MGSALRLGNLGWQRGLRTPPWGRSGPNVSIEHRVRFLDDCIDDHRLPLAVG
jgi:hypothetical protein